MFGAMNRFLPLVAFVLVTGCANANSIFRVRSLSDPRSTVVVVDAKQRAILSNPPDATHTRYRRFCSEPSPDVFSVLSQSLSGSASANVDSTARTVAAALQGAFSNSEAGSTIARTQTINMLREMMFRTCERYLSGAIDDTEFPIVAARDQRIIVSILSIEQLTGAVAPKPVVIGSTGSSSTGLDATAAMKLVAKAKEDLDAAEAAVVAAGGKMDKADGDAGTGKCAGLAGEAAPDAAKKKACDEATAALADAKALRDRQQAYYDTQTKGLASSMGVSSAATSASGTVDGKDWTIAQATAVASVATSVEHIVRATFEQDETQYFCFRMIATERLQSSIADNIGGDEARGIADRCVGYLMTKIEAAAASEAQRVGLTPLEYRTSTEVGVRSGDRRIQIVERLRTCAGDPARSAQLDQALADYPSVAAVLRRAGGAGGSELSMVVDELGSTGQRGLAAALDAACR